MSTLEGIPREPEAREQFARTQHMELDLVGLITTDGGTLGRSPDALIKGRKEGLEVDWPAAPAHVGYMLDGPGQAYKVHV